MRYFFNMPTIWVHESSYLLLGMQYLLAGGYTLLHGGHVRRITSYNVCYTKLLRNASGVANRTFGVVELFAGTFGHRSGRSQQGSGCCQNHRFFHRFYL